jgi:hypothetical protein
VEVDGVEARAAQRAEAGLHQHVSRQHNISPSTLLSPPSHLNSPAPSFASLHHSPQRIARVASVLRSVDPPRTPFPLAHAPSALGPSLSVDRCAGQCSLVALNEHASSALRRLRANATHAREERGVSRSSVGHSTSAQLRPDLATTAVTATHILQERGAQDSGKMRQDRLCCETLARSTPPHNRCVCAAPAPCERASGHAACVLVRGILTMSVRSEAGRGGGDDLR